MTGEVSQRPEVAASATTGRHSPVFLRARVLFVSVAQLECAVVTDEG